MNMHEAVCYARFLSQLTQFQLIVLGWIVKGLTPQQVAKKLCYAESTISYHLTQIYEVAREVWKPLPGEKRDYQFLYRKFAKLRQNDELWSWLSSVHGKQLLQILPALLLRVQLQPEVLTDQDRKACAQVVAQLKGRKNKLNVLRAAAEGLGREQIAGRLGLSVKTVDGYLGEIFIQCDNAWDQTQHSCKFLERKFANYFPLWDKENLCM